MTHINKTKIGTDECPHEDSGEGCPVDCYMKCTRDCCKYGPIGRLGDYHDHGIEVSNEDLSRDESVTDEMEWESYTMYSCPNCGHEMSESFDNSLIIKKYSKLYKCEMEFVKCPQCNIVSVFRM